MTNNRPSVEKFVICCSCPGMRAKIATALDELEKTTPGTIGDDYVEKIWKESEIEKKKMELSSLEKGLDAFLAIGSIQAERHSKPEFAYLFKVYANGFIGYIYDLTTGRRIM